MGFRFVLGAQGDHVGRIQPDGDFQRGLTIRGVVQFVRIGTGIEFLPGPGQMIALNGLVQCGFAAAVDQVGSEFSVVAMQRAVNRRCATLMATGNVGSMVEKPIGNFGMAGFSRMTQRGIAAVVKGINSGTKFQQFGEEDFGSAGGSRNVKRQFIPLLRLEQAIENLQSIEGADAIRNKLLEAKTRNLVPLAAVKRFRETLDAEIQRLTTRRPALAA